MTWTIHIAFSWSWWAFAAGLALGAIAGRFVTVLMVEDAILQSWLRR